MERFFAGSAYRRFFTIVCALVLFVSGCQKEEDPGPSGPGDDIKLAVDVGDSEIPYLYLQTNGAVQRNYNLWDPDGDLNYDDAVQSLYLTRSGLGKFPINSVSIYRTRNWFGPVLTLASVFPNHFDVGIKGFLEARTGWMDQEIGTF